jgi:hypothetical protein
MTTVREFAAATYGKSCHNNKALWEKTSQEIYDGTVRPDLWVIVLAHADLATAKTTIATAINNAAAALPAGDLKTKMLAFNAAHTTEELNSLRAWAEPLRRTGTPGLSTPAEIKASCKLHSALMMAAKFLQNEDPSLAAGTVRRLMSYYIIENGTDLTTEKAAMYTFLRGAVDFNTWKGSYT